MSWTGIDEEKQGLDEQAKEEIRKCIFLLEGAINMTSLIDSYRRLLSREAVNKVYNLRNQAGEQIKSLRELFLSSNSLLDQWWQEEHRKLGEKNSKLENKILQLEQKVRENQEQEPTERISLTGKSDFYSVKDSGSESQDANTSFYTPPRIREEKIEIPTLPCKLWEKPFPPEIASPSTHQESPSLTRKNSSEWSFLSVVNLILLLIALYTIIKSIINGVRCLFRVLRVRNKRNL